MSKPSIPWTRIFLGWGLPFAIGLTAWEALEQLGQGSIQWLFWPFDFVGGFIGGVATGLIWNLWFEV